MASDFPRERLSQGQFSEFSDGSANRRKFVRYRIDLPCRCVKEAFRAKGTVLDLSAGGCRMTTNITPITPLDYFAIEIHCLVDYCPLSVDLAVVRWKRGEELGMEFIRMKPLQQERLRHLVAFIETGHRLQIDSDPGSRQWAEGGS